MFILSRSTAGCVFICAASSALCGTVRWVRCTSITVVCVELARRGLVYARWFCYASASATIRLGQSFALLAIYRHLLLVGLLETRRKASSAFRFLRSCGGLGFVGNSLLDSLLHGSVLHTFLYDTCAELAEETVGFSGADHVQ